MIVDAISFVNQFIYITTQQRQAACPLTQLIFVLVHFSNLQRRSALHKIGQIFLHSDTKHKSAGIIRHDRKLLTLLKKQLKLLQWCLRRNLLKLAAGLAAAAGTGGRAELDVVVSNQTARGTGTSSLAQKLSSQIP